MGQEEYLPLVCKIQHGSLRTLQQRHPDPPLTD